ncbi:MAG: O-methyltransferase [Casimicrobiaceae bacterium]
MSQQENLWIDVDEYYAATLARPDDALDAALRASVAAGLPEISVSACQGRMLQLLAQMQQARNILEIGTLGGYSTIWMARALPAGGRMVTLEVSPHHATVARVNLTHAGLADVVDVRIGPALDTLPLLAAEGLAPFEFTFIDADKANNPEYFAWALKLSRNGGVIVVDNVVRDGKVLDAASTDASVRGVRRLTALIAATPHVTATTVQTVGAKGYDGFILARIAVE